MTLTISTYTNGKPQTTAATVPSEYPKHRKVTRHDGPEYVLAVQGARAAINSLLWHARPRQSVTADSVGDAVIEAVPHFNTRELHALAVIVGMLERASAKHNR
jgi:hypothetical protein